VVPSPRGLQRDADATPARSWRSGAGQYALVSSLGSITRFRAPVPGARRPSSVAATAAGGWGCARGWKEPAAIAPGGHARGFTSTLKQMTKAQLIEAVASKTSRERPDVEAVLESVLGTIAEALHANQRVDLRGFGSFVVKDKKERQGRNPRTGETITIAAKRDASFKAGKELSEKLIEPNTETSLT